MIADRAVEQDEREFAELLNVIGVAWPKVILELGVFEGGTLARFAERYPDAKVIGVDPVLQPKARELWREFPNVALVEGHSQDARVRGRVLDLAGGALDVVHIDGDHSYYAALEDWTFARYSTRRPALVAFHDVNRHDDPGPCEVWRLWAELEADEGLSTRTIGSDTKNGIGVVWLT